MKSKIKYLAFAVLLIFLFPILTLASNSPTHNINVNNISSEWQLDTEINGVQVYLKKVQCDDVTNGIFSEYVLIKLVNTTILDLKIKWSYELWYDGKCYTCNSTTNEYDKEIILTSSEMEQGVCNTQESPLKIFVKFTNYKDVPKLTDFKMINLQVNPTR